MKGWRIGKKPRPVLQSTDDKMIRVKHLCMDTAYQQATKNIVELAYSISLAWEVFTLRNCYRPVIADKRRYPSRCAKREGCHHFCQLVAIVGVRIDLIEGDIQSRSFITIDCRIWEQIGHPGGVIRRNTRNGLRVTRRGFFLFNPVSLVPN